MLICILGRQPALGLAELESIFGKDSVRPLGPAYATVDADPDRISQNTLGGTIKIAEAIATVPSTEAGKVSKEAVGRIAGFMEATKAHKFTFGISAYGLQATPKQVSNLSFAVKKRLKSSGHSVRAVLNEKAAALNSAQLIHNGLVGGTGHEFLLVAGDKETYIAKTTSVQDIDSYSKRDYGRPGRDTKVGMLPPKLAQMMLNLAWATPGLTVLDPFCGTGMILMEAALRRSGLEGGDINPRMVECTKTNVEWLSREFGIDANARRLVRADATTHKWKNHFDRVVTEMYLGPPLTALPDPEDLKGIVNECNMLATRFLSNLRPQLDFQSRCCIAVPAWVSEKGLVHLPVVNQLPRLGYTRVIFSNARTDQMVYYRKEQIVARELLVLEIR